MTACDREFAAGAASLDQVQPIRAHYREAERLIERANEIGHEDPGRGAGMLASAQVHAILALAADAANADIVPAGALDIAWNALQHIALHADDKSAANARAALRAINEYMEDGTTEDGIDRTPRQPQPAPELAGLNKRVASLYRLVDDILTCLKAGYLPGRITPRHVEEWEKRADDA